MLEDVIDDDLLGLIRVHPGERVHVNDGVFKPHQREAQGAFQSLTRSTDERILFKMTF